MMSLSAKDKEKMRIFAGSSSKKLAEKNSKLFGYEVIFSSNRKICGWRNLCKIR